MPNLPPKEQTKAKRYICPSFLSFRTFVTPDNLPTVLQYFAWAPNGSKYASLNHPELLIFYLLQYRSHMWTLVAVSTLGCVSQVYVSENNIFLKSDVTAEAVQVTTNGKRNEILNGIPDWVYEGKRYRVAEWHNRAAWYLLDYCSYLQLRAVKWC